VKAEHYAIKVQSSFTPLAGCPSNIQSMEFRNDTFVGCYQDTVLLDLLEEWLPVEDGSLSLPPVSAIFNKSLPRSGSRMLDTFCIFLTMDFVVH
jgi:hypothetical protein